MDISYGKTFFSPYLKFQIDSLTLTFFKKINIWINFWTGTGSVFILLTWFLYGKTFLSVLKKCPVTLAFNFKLNLGLNFLTERDIAFILHMAISYRKTFLSVSFLSLDLDLHLCPFLKTNLTFSLTFEPKEILRGYKSSSGGINPVRTAMPICINPLLNLLQTIW